MRAVRHRSSTPNPTAHAHRPKVAVDAQAVTADATKQNIDITTQQQVRMEQQLVSKVSAEAIPPDAPSASQHQDVKPVEKQGTSTRTLGPARLPDLLVTLGSDQVEKALQPRLQCWDFPGQQEYSICNLLYFEVRGIYLVFCDLSCEMKEAWTDLKFWLWAIARVCKDAPKAPPVLLAGTKCQHKDALDIAELERHIQGFLKQMPFLEKQLQPSPREYHSQWVFPVENFAGDPEEFIRPLRHKLEELSLEILTPVTQWQKERPQSKAVPECVGLQAERYPVAWLRAFDLFSDLASGVDLRVTRASLQESLGPVLQDGHARLTSDLQCEHAAQGHDFLAPATALVEVMDASDTPTDSLVLIRVKCDSLSEKQTIDLLGGMQPEGIPNHEVSKVLELLHSLGLLFWFKEADLRKRVLLNIRMVAVALSSIITLRFFAERKFQHADDYRRKLEKVCCDHRSKVQQFQTSGVVSKKLLEALWEDLFPVTDEGHAVSDDKQVVLEIMLRKALLLRRGVEDEFLGCC